MLISTKLLPWHTLKNSHRPLGSWADTCRLDLRRRQLSHSISTPPDELAVRSLILGIVHCTIGDYNTGRALLNDALKHGANVEVSTWVSAVAYIELAVLEMKEGERSAARRQDNPAEKASNSEEEKGVSEWPHTFKAAKDMLGLTTTLCAREMDLSSRLDSQIVMLRDEIERKMEMEGIPGVR